MLPADITTAVQASPDSWVVLNSEQTSGPYTLDEVQAIRGKYMYGTAYLRMNMPVAGGRQSLGRWSQQQHNAEAVRYLQVSQICVNLVAMIANYLHRPAGAAAVLPSHTTHVCDALKSTVPQTEACLSIGCCSLPLLSCMIMKSPCNFWSAVFGIPCVESD